VIAPVVVMDVGDVLVETVPMAHYRELACRTGLTWEQVAGRIEGSGIVRGFETGRLTCTEFASEVRGTLGCPELRPEDVREAWNAVLARPDPVLAPIAACLAASGRLLLASNTSPWHWQVACRRLADAGITAPACLSFEAGHAKPDSRFFTALCRLGPRAGAGGVYVDDRPEHVEAAARHGLTAWLHTDARATARYLAGLLD